MCRALDGAEEEDEEAESRARGLRAALDAAIAGDQDEVEEILGGGSALIESVDGSGRTALTKAAAAGHSDVVAFLIEQGADVGRRDTGGASVLLWACEGDDEDAACELAGRSSRQPSRSSCLKVVACSTSPTL